MDLLLTDRLCCPRCGPEFGLILLADTLEDRRVYEGGLGCSNCRDSYPVRDGVADLRAAPRAAETAPDFPDSEGPTAAEIGGLLGVLRGPGHLLLLGSLGTRARALAELIEGIEVVSTSGHVPGTVEEAGVSRLLVRSALPFQTRSLRGVALCERDQPCDLAEVARVIAPGGRLSMVQTESDAGARVRSLGLEIIAEEESRLVARR
jgi:uncharacterized protein YbaR (Trm112 family)